MHNAISPLVSMPRLAPCGLRLVMLLAEAVSLLLLCIPSVHATANCSCQCPVRGGGWTTVDSSGDGDEDACNSYCDHSSAIAAQCPNDFQSEYIPLWSSGTIVAISIGSVAGFLLLCSLFSWCRKRRLRNQNTVMVQNTIATSREPTHVSPGPQIVYVQAPPVGYPQPYPYAYPPPYTGQGYTLASPPPPTWYSPTTVPPPTNEKPKQ
jgi:hypothetical protein